MEPTITNEVQQLAESLQVGKAVVSRKVEAVSVSLNSNDEMCKQLVDQAAFRSHCNVLLTVEELQLYIAILVYARIGFVCAANSREFFPRVKALQPRFVKYPAVFFPLLASLGEVTDENLAITFHPTVPQGYDVKALIDKATPEFMGYVVDQLVKLESIGLQLATGMPKEHLGSYGYVMVLKASQLVSPSNQASPADAVIAAILRNVGYETVMRYPFCYGDITSFTSVEAQLASRAFLKAR